MPAIEIHQFRQPFGEGAAAEAKAILDRGGVRLKEGATDRFFEAQVPFFRRFHDVWMEIQSDGRIDHECTCPHLENTGLGCAHLYVLFLLAKERLAEASEEAQADQKPLRPTFVLKTGVAGPLRVDVLFQPAGDASGHPRPLEIDSEVLERIDTDNHRELLLFLLPYAGGKRNRLDGGGFGVPRGPWTLPAGRRWPWLEELVDAGLLAVESGESPPSTVPIDAVHREPLTLTMGFRAEGDARVRLEVGLVSKGTTLPLRGGRIHATDAEALVSLGGTLCPVEHFGAAEWLRFGTSGKSLPVERGRVAALLKELGQSGPLPEVVLPGEERVRVRHDAPTPRARLSTSRGLFRLDVDFLYGKCATRPEDHERLLLDPTTGEQWQRQLEVEAKVLRELEAHSGLDASEGVLGRYFIDTDPEWLAQDLLSRGFAVDLDGRALRRPGPVRVAAQRQGSWMDVQAEVSFGEGDPVRLDALLLALKENRPFVRLSTGALGHLSEEVSTRLRTLAGMLERGRGERLPAARAALLHGVLGDGFEADAEFGRLLRGIEAARAPTRIAPRPTFQGTLRPYQELGVGWITGLAAHGLGGCLADDMGLGKTVQVLAFLERRMEKANKPILIVAPRSVLWNWEQEVRRFLGVLPFVRHYGPGRAKTPAELVSANLLLTTYGTLLRDQELLASVPLDSAILDEAQVIRNSSSQTSLAARALNADFRLALTGTPIENRIEDLWSIMEFANPGLLPAERAFASHMRSTDAHGRTPLVQVLRPLVLRRTKAEVATDLPPKVEQILRAPMEAEQGRLYEALRAKAAARIGEATDSGGPTLEVLEAILRLRQTACHPGLVDPSLAGEPSGKILVLMAELEQLAESGHKCLVFSQFTSFLRLVEARIRQSGIQTAWLDGSTRDRGAAITRFQEDLECKVFLISLKAGGTGLNLVAADYVFLLDPWWNPAAEDQAADRAHRIGQTKQVFVYRLVTAGTVEERVLSLQADKRAVASRFLESEASGTDLKPEDLRFLLAPDNTF